MGPAEQAGLTACGMFTLSNGVLRQAPAVSALLSPSPQKQHSPDSSATVTGEPCSDASDLTSSHHGNLHIQKQHKRARLTAPEAAQQAGEQPAQQRPVHSSSAAHGQGSGSHGGMQNQPDSARQAPTSLLCQGSSTCEPREHQQPGCSMPLLHSTAPGQQSHSRPDCYDQRQPGAGSQCVAPAYTPYHVPGLTPRQQAVKDQEDQELAQALRQQQNVFRVGYEVDEFGVLQLPQQSRPRAVSMKFVFAQRWQHQTPGPATAQGAQLSMQQLLLEDGDALETQEPSAVMAEPMLEDQQVNGSHAEYDLQMTSVPVAGTKLPMRFQLSQAKQAMRKAESGSPKISCTMSSASQNIHLQDGRHTAWQLEQLANSCVVNDPFVEQYIDKQNESFDGLYWSMLESLAPFQ